jgi:hypothetical protein
MKIWNSIGRAVLALVSSWYLGWLTSMTPAEHALLYFVLLSYLRSTK